MSRPSVLIKGADRGLGLSLAREYLNRGWLVFAGKFLDDYFLLEDLGKKYPNLHIIKLDAGCVNSITAARDMVCSVTDSLDMLIANAAMLDRDHAQCRIFEQPMDPELTWNFFRINALGPMILTEKFLPLLDKGEMKRLCFVSSEVSCIVLMKNRTDSSYPYPISKTALNMGVRLLHNQLYAQGYTFRLFHPGWMKRREQDGSLAGEGNYDPEYIGSIAAQYFETTLRDDHRLVMIDYNGNEWTF